MNCSGTKLWSAHLHASWLQADPHALLSLSITTTVVIKKEKKYIYIPLARNWPIPIWAVLGYTGFLFICLWTGTWLWVPLCLVYFLICMDIFFYKKSKVFAEKVKGLITNEAVERQNQYHFFFIKNFVPDSVRRPCCCCISFLTWWTSGCFSNSGCSFRNRVLSVLTH